MNQLNEGRKANMTMQQIAYLVTPLPQPTEEDCGCNWTYGDCRHAYPAPACNRRPVRLVNASMQGEGTYRLPLCEQCFDTMMQLEKLADAATESEQIRLVMKHGSPWRRN